MLGGAEIAALALLASVPLFIGNPYALGLLTLLAIYGILLIGLDVSVGYLGQVNLAQAAFLGIGAYASGLCVTRLGFGLFPSLGASLLAGLVFGGLLAYPALRLEGPQFALSTLSFSALTVTTLNELEWLTGGAQGLQLKRPPLFGHPLSASGFYWFCLIFLVLVWLGMKNLLSSHWGRAFEAIRDSPMATDAMGVGAHRYRILAFAFGSAVGSLAGGLYAFNFQYLQPQTFVYELMVILLLGIVLGGRKNLWGAMAGATLIVLLPNLISERFFFQMFSFIGFVLAVISGLRSARRKERLTFQNSAPLIALSLLMMGGFLIKNTEDWRKAIFAILLFSVVVGLPNGIMGAVGLYLSSLFRIEPPRLPRSSPEEEVLPGKRRSGILLEMINIKRYFGGIRAVDGITLNIESGTIHGIIGPNGSGKSTLVNLISGLYSPTEGKILLAGTQIPPGSLLKAARRGVSRTFQTSQLFLEITALENVMVALRGVYRAPLFLVLSGFSRREEIKAREKGLALLRLVGLENEAQAPAKDLTYGSQRMLEIARAVATMPELLILDEPAAGLAHSDILRQIEIIRKINQSGITIILIEHHMDVVNLLCNRVTVLDGGKIIADGTPDEVKRNSRVIEAYLGEVRKSLQFSSTPFDKKDSILAIENLHAGYGTSAVLSGVSFQVGHGKVVALIGANGAGKTTTLRTISGILKPTQGKIILDGKEIQGIPAPRIARMGLAHSPEGRRVFSSLRVEDNLLLGAYRNLPKFFGFHRKSKGKLEEIYRLFPRLQERRKQLAGTLSGGEQQMLAIGRALMSDPKVILLDEPSMGLAPVIVKELFEILIQLKRAGITLLLVEQFARSAMEVSDYAYVMEQGKIVIEGTPEALSRDARVISAYLG